MLCWSVGPINEAPPTRAEGTAQRDARSVHKETSSIRMLTCVAISIFNNELVGRAAKKG